MIPPPAGRSGTIAASESRCVRSGLVSVPTSEATRRASRPRAGHQQVVG
jgi:hypothetical protein